MMNMAKPTLALIFILAASSLLAAEDAGNSQCPIAPIPSYLDITVDDASGQIIARAYNISGNYDKMPINRGLVYRINLTGVPNQEPITVCYDVTDQSGNVFTAYDPMATGCIDYRYIFCPVDARTSECLKNSGIAGVTPQSRHSNFPPCKPSVGAFDEHTDYLASHNEYYVCNTAPADMAQFCWPLMLILSLLLGASFAAGRNPFLAFDFSTPRMNRGRQYSMRVQQRNFDIMAYVMGVDRAVSTADKATGGTGRNSLTGYLSGLVASQVIAFTGHLESLLAGKSDEQQVKIIEGEIKEIDSKLKELEGKAKLTDGEKAELMSLKQERATLDNKLSAVQQRIEGKKIAEENVKTVNEVAKAVPNSSLTKSTGSSTTTSTGSSMTTSIGIGQKAKSQELKSAAFVGYSAVNIPAAIVGALMPMSSEDARACQEAKLAYMEFMDKYRPDNYKSLSRAEQIIIDIGLALLFSITYSAGNSLSADNWWKTMISATLQWLTMGGKRQKNWLTWLPEQVEGVFGKDIFTVAKYINQPESMPLGMNIFSGSVDVLKGEWTKILNSGSLDKTLILGQIYTGNNKQYFAVNMGNGEYNVRDENGNWNVMSERYMRQKGIDLTGDGWLVYNNGNGKWSVHAGMNNKEIQGIKEDQIDYLSAMVRQQLTANPIKELDRSKRDEDGNLPSDLREQDAYNTLMKTKLAHLESLQNTLYAMKNGTPEEVISAIMGERLSGDALNSANYLYELAFGRKVLEKTFDDAERMTAGERNMALDKLKTQTAEKLQEMTGISKNSPAESDEDYITRVKEEYVNKSKLDETSLAAALLIDKYNVGKTIYNNPKLDEALVYNAINDIYKAANVFVEVDQTALRLFQHLQSDNPVITEKSFNRIYSLIRNAENKTGQTSLNDFVDLNKDLNTLLNYAENSSFGVLDGTFSDKFKPIMKRYCDLLIGLKEQEDKVKGMKPDDPAYKGEKEFEQGLYRDFQIFSLIADNLHDAVRTATDLHIDISEKKTLGLEKVNSTVNFDLPDWNKYRNMPEGEEKNARANELYQELHKDGMRLVLDRIKSMEEIEGYSGKIKQKDIEGLKKEIELQIANIENMSPDKIANNLNVIKYAENTMYTVPTGSGIYVKKSQYEQQNLTNSKETWWGQSLYMTDLSQLINESAGGNMSRAQERQMLKYITDKQYVDDLQKSYEKRKEFPPDPPSTSSSLAEWNAWRNDIEEWKSRHEPPYPPSGEPMPWEGETEKRSFGRKKK